MSNFKKVHEFELTVRAIDDMVPTMSTEALRKWQGILRTALVKTEQELTSTSVHTCRICLFQEWGYRDELPSMWYKKGDAEICFQHEYKDSERLLKEAGHDVDAFFPPEIPDVSTGALQVTMDNLPSQATEAEKALDELMELV